MRHLNILNRLQDKTIYVKIITGCFLIFSNVSKQINV